MKLHFIQVDAKAYVEELENQSPIVSTSHHALRVMYDRYGQPATDRAVDTALRIWGGKLARETLDRIGDQS